MIAKVEWHRGELFPRVGFIVTNRSARAPGVVHFYNGRGRAEQWIKEGKYALNWTRLSCQRFIPNQVRLGLFVLAYNLGNFLRRLVLPRRIKHWSLRTLGNDLPDYCRQARKPFWREELKKRGVNESACSERTRKAKSQKSLLPGSVERWSLATLREKLIKIGAKASDLVSSLWISTAIGNVIQHSIWEPLDEYIYETGKGIIKIKYGKHESILPIRKIIRNRRDIDLERRSITEAYDVFKLLLHEMADMAQTHRVLFGMLFIPTKENALFEKIDPSASHYDVVKDKVFLERALIGDLTELLHQWRIPTADPTRCLQSTSDEPLYPAGIDSHPLEAGYRCYAEAASELLLGKTALSSDGYTYSNHFQSDIH